MVLVVSASSPTLLVVGMALRLKEVPRPAAWGVGRRSRAETDRRGEEETTACGDVSPCLALSSAADGSDAQTFPVTAGVNKLQLPLVPGGSMHGTLTRAGATVIDLAATNFTFNPNPAAFNYNAFTISATSA